MLLIAKKKGAGGGVKEKKKKTENLAAVRLEEHLFARTARVNSGIQALVQSR